MTNGGDAAEQMVRLSLEGVEVAAKLTGSAAKSVAVMLAAALRQEGKTKGKARLNSMIRSGKELKVFSLQEKDMKIFKEQAKKYGVLYCVLANKHPKGTTVPVDVIARAEDAAKIQRIVERFSLGALEQAHVRPEAVPTQPGNDHPSGQSSERDKTPDKKRTSVKEKLNRLKREAELDRKRSQKERTKERTASRKSKRYYNSRKVQKQMKSGGDR